VTTPPPLLLAAVLLLASGCAETRPRAASARVPAGGSELPLRRQGDVLLVRGRLGPADDLVFLLDTGTDRMLLDPATVRRLGLTGAAGGGSVRSANGTEVEYQGLLRIASLWLGSAEFLDFDAGVVDLGALSNTAGLHIDGILGCDLFRQCVLRLDLPAHTAAVSTEPHRPAGDEFELPFTDSVPWVQADVAGRPFRLLLDTGFQRELALPPELTSDLEWRRGPRADGEVVTVSGSEPKARAQLRGDLHLGPYTWTRPWVTLATGSPKLGLLLLRRCVVVLDGPGQRLWLSQPRGK